MKKLLSGACAALLAASFGIASIAPVEAAPISAPKFETSSDVTQIRDRHWRHGGNWRHGGYRDGYRYRHRNNGAGAAAAIIGGALITGAIINSQQPRYVERRVERRVYANDSHEAWCANRYRSYRAWDNTFQPYNGPRQQCYSPY